MIRDGSLKCLLPLRAVLVTGKGGVGKTTVAASLARFAAQSGKRVLVTETAHDEPTASWGSARTRAGTPRIGKVDLRSSPVPSPLADALGVAEIGEEPEEIGPNLSVAVLSPTVGHRRFLREVLPMGILADAAMRSAAIRRFLSAAPTFPEMGVLYRLLDLARRRRSDGRPAYETIIVDLPATGHALALAQVPEAILGVMSAGPIANALREGLDLLTDPSQTGAVVVTLPETLPVSEAIELVHGLEQHRIPVAQVLVNRVPFDPFTPAEKERIRALLDGRPPTLGARTLARIDRAGRALDRLARSVSLPISTLEDVWLEGPRLAEEMASLMDVEAGRGA